MDDKISSKQLKKLTQRLQKSIDRLHQLKGQKEAYLNNLLAITGAKNEEQAYAFVDDLGISVKTQETIFTRRLDEVKENIDKVLNDVRKQMEGNQDD